jgi:hypothetical protein
MEIRRRLPNATTILAWLGVIGTILGIIGFFISDLPGLFGNQPEGLSEEQIIATLVALQDDKERAELQLTQIALENLRAANQATQQAINQQQADFQATLDAIQAEQEAVVATGNAVAAMTATADAANAAATQVAQDITATADFLAQITPTVTPTPTPTPTPEPVVDHRSLVAAAVQPTGEGTLQFAVQAAQPIPEEPQEGLAYVWSLDTDRDPETGLELQDIGVDVRLAVRFKDGAWIGRATVIQPDGTPGETFLFLDVTLDGALLVATLDPVELGLPLSFDWIARAELGGEAYSFWPADGHNTLSPAESETAS